MITLFYHRMLVPQLCIRLSRIVFSRKLSLSHIAARSIIYLVALVALSTLFSFIHSLSEFLSYCRHTTKIVALVHLISCLNTYTYTYTSFLRTRHEN